MAKMAEDLTRFSDLCRLCASKTSFIGVHIFEKEGMLRQLCKKIENCLPVEINASDQLPKFICNNCLYKLDFVVDFRERSVKTERILKELFKGPGSDRLHSQTDILDQNDLIMVQSHQLLSDHGLQSIDITLSQREDIMVEHEIILSEHNVHSLDSIELSSALTNQELSNESLPSQDAIMVDSGNTQSLHDASFEDDNLSLIQHSHQLLTDQLRLHHGLNVNMTDDTAVNISLSDENVKNEHLASDNYLPYNNAPKESEIFEDSMNDLHIDHQYIPSDMKPDDDNSGNSLLNAHVTSQEAKSDFVHVIDAHSKDWYYCNLCEKAFENKDEFDRHYSCHFYKCELCLQVFTTFESLTEHALVHEEEDKNDKKRLKLDTVPAFQKNESKEESNSEESDPDCDNEPIEELGREVEEVGMNNNRKKKCPPKVCQTCGKSYKTNYKLREHMRKHTGEKPFKCGSCDKAFRSKIGLMQHEAVHTGQYSYSCPTCGKGFQCKSYLMVHQRVHSNVKPYHCTTCGQNFKTKQSLLDHTNRHLGLKPYICDICGRGFITKGLCKAHAKIHTGTDNRKYACKICTKMFVSKSYLQTHLRIHTGEKPFKCEVCEKGFLTRVDLKIHSTIHTGEKSFVCEICGKAFARRDALRCHTRSHTGERPYSCEICGQTFTQFTPMAIHKRLHTGERPYKCETCDRTFVSRSTMMSHAKKH